MSEPPQFQHNFFPSPPTAMPNQSQNETGKQSSPDRSLQQAAKETFSPGNFKTFEAFNESEAPESPKPPKSSEPAKPPKSPESPKSPELSSVEVLRMDEKGMDEITQVPPNSKKSWMPWKRPNRRDQQLRHLREGYIELLGLVRSISGHLDRQKDEKSQVSELAESLPPALASFETLANSQKEVTSILGNLNSHMEKTSVKDEQLLENLEGFNTALKEVSNKNEKSLGTLHQVSERIEHSDEQMKKLFENANQSSQAAGALMVRLEKRVFLSNLALVCLLCLILLLGIFWIAKQEPQIGQTVLNVPATPAAPVAQAAPAAPVSQVAPTEEVAANPAPAETASVETEEQKVFVEQPIESVGILGNESTPFPTESEEEVSEIETPSVLRPELLAPTVKEEGEAETEATAKEEQFKDLQLFEF